MGLFDTLFKKNNRRSAGQTEGEENQLKELERHLIQQVAMTMFQMKITKQPGLKYIQDDPGLFEGIFTMHMLDTQLQALAKQDFGNYLMVLGCHALGGAAYALTCQLKYMKPAAEFGKTEILEIIKTFYGTDAYELGLKALKFAPNGNNKKCLDQVVVAANNAARQLVGDKMREERYQRVYMQVLFNAGVTLIYGN